MAYLARCRLINFVLRSLFHRQQIINQICKRPKLYLLSSSVTLTSVANMATDSRITRGQMASSQRDRYLKMPLNEKRSHYHCGSNYLTKDNIPTWPEYCKSGNLGKYRSGLGPVFNGTQWYNKLFSFFSSKSPKFSYGNKDFNEKLSVWRGDITTLEIDAIVNAANKSLLGGGGVDGAIHRSAGPELKTESGSLAPCDTGEAKLTGGYRLPAKYVIHTVGPVGEKPPLLKQCYKNSLNLAKEKGLRTIAFPCISTGVYGYPADAAALVVINTIREWFEMDDNATKIDRIIFVIFDPRDLLIYESLLKEYFPIE